VREATFDGANFEGAESCGAIGLSVEQVCLCPREGAARCGCRFDKAQRKSRLWQRPADWGDQAVMAFRARAGASPF